MFHLTNKESIEVDTSNFANVNVCERIDLSKVFEWVKQSFSYQSNPQQLIKYNSAQGLLEIKAVNLRDGKPLGIKI